MKKLLLPLLLSYSTLAFAQQKSFIKKHLYIKAAPTLLGTAKVTEHLRTNDFLAPAIFGAVGAKTRYAALGFSAGYFNMKGEAGASITPLGVDLTITDFKRKKIFPILTAQWHKIRYKDEYFLGRGASQQYIISGNDMRSIAAGVAFRVFKESKLTITLGYSRMYFDTRHGSRTPTPVSGEPWERTYRDLKDQIEMATLGIGFIF